MPKPKYHIIICTNDRPPGHPRGSCGERGAKDLMMKFFEEIGLHDLFRDILLTESTCTGPCHLGISVIVYPDGVWYHKVTEADVAEIIEEHIMKGKPVQRLIMPDEAWT